MPRSCPALLIKTGHGWESLPTTTTENNEALSAGRAVHTQTWQWKLVYLFVCAPLLGMQWTECNLNLIKLRLSWGVRLATLTFFLTSLTNPCFHALIASLRENS